MAKDSLNYRVVVIPSGTVDAEERLQRVYTLLMNAFLARINDAEQSEALTDPSADPEAPNA